MREKSKRKKEWDIISHRRKVDKQSLYTQYMRKHICSVRTSTCTRRLTNHKLLMLH